MKESSDIKKIVGLALKKMRSEKDITQEKLAEYIGVQTQTIAKIETGKRFISSRVLAKLCNFFEAEPQEFFVSDKKLNSPDILAEIKIELKEIRKILSENEKTPQL